jgi:hypothetical protein
LGEYAFSVEIRNAEKGAQAAIETGTTAIIVRRNSRRLEGPTKSLILIEMVPFGVF